MPQLLKLPALQAATCCSPRLRVVHITEAPLGGVLGCIQEIISAHVNSGDFESIHALMPEINVPPLRASVPSTVEVRSFKHRRGSLSSLLWLALGTLRIVRDVRPDIVHVHSTIAGIIVRLCLAFLRNRPKILYCPHLWVFCRPGGGFMRSLTTWLERLLSYVTDGIICVSDYEKREAVAAGISAEKCIVVQNGIAEHSDATDDGLLDVAKRTGKLKILFVGRFDHQKGFDFYLETMRRLKDVAEGVAVGSFMISKDRPVVVPSNVSMVGWCSREDLHGIYKTADLMLMPSRSESSPLVAIEAMRVGLSVFASRVGGLPEIVIDNVTGRLFDLGNVEQLVDVIRSTSRATLMEYGCRGQARFLSHFTASRMSASLLLQYRRLLLQDGLSYSVFVTE